MRIEIPFLCLGAGGRDLQRQELLDKYKELNSKIKVEQVDPALNPGFLTGDRKDIVEGSLVVESAKRSKIITSLEIFYPGISEEEIYYYYQQTGSMPSQQGFAAESCITSALDYVTTDILPKVYTLTGHGEMTLSDTYKKYITEKSMELNELNLVSLSAVPDDCDSVLICTPEKDITADEATKLLDYLKKGGTLMYISYFGYTAETAHTNLNTVLEYYGMTANKGYVVEGDANKYLPNYPNVIIPNYGSHEIVTPLQGYYMVLSYAQGITIKDDVRSSVNITPLLTTSDKAYSKTNMAPETLEKEEGDVAGPFNVAVAATEKNEDGSEAKVIWINTPAVVQEAMDYFGANSAMFTNSFSWMCGKTDSISIPVKEIESSTLSLTEAQGNIWTIMFAVILPLAIVVCGFVVWYRRRRK